MPHLALPPALVTPGTSGPIKGENKHRNLAQTVSLSHQTFHDFGALTGTPFVCGACCIRRPRNNAMSLPYDDDSRGIWMKDLTNTISTAPPLTLSRKSNDVPHSAAARVDFVTNQTLRRCPGRQDSPVSNAGAIPQPQAATMRLQMCFSALVCVVYRSRSRMTIFGSRMLCTRYVPKIRALSPSLTISKQGGITKPQTQERHVSSKRTV